MLTKIAMMYASRWRARVWLLFAAWVPAAFCATAGGGFRSGFEAGAIASVVDSANGRYTSMAMGADGLPVIAYQDSTAGTLMVAKCDDPACSGGNEILSVVDDPANIVGEFASIAIGIDGLPVISYWDQTAFALKVAKCNDPACSGGDETISTLEGADPAERVGLHTSIAIGADGLPVISYIDDTTFALKVARCNDSACSGSDETLSIVDDESAEFVGLYTAIAIGPDRLPVISYYFSDGALKVAKCNDPACSGGDESLTLVDYPANRVGWDTSIAIGSDGLPVISYYDVTAGALKVAKCHDPACAIGDQSIATVDDPDNSVGAYTSIAIGDDGLPVISYYDCTAGTLKVAKCGSLNCSTDNSIVTLADRDGRVGAFSSLIVGVDGLPVIGYRDGASGSLKVTRCADGACAGNSR